MCWKVQCEKCQLYTWAGCGQHKEQVMSKIPMDQRCICDKHKNENDNDVTIMHNDDNKTYDEKNNCNDESKLNYYAH